MPLIKIDQNYIEFGSPAEWIHHVDLENDDYSKIFQEDLEELRRLVNEKYGQTDGEGNFEEAFGGVVLRILKIRFTDREPLYCFAFVALKNKRIGHYASDGDYTGPVCPPFDRKRPSAKYDFLDEIAKELDQISKVFTRADLEQWALRLNPGFSGFEYEKSFIPEEIELNRTGFSQLFKSLGLPMPSNKQLNRVFCSSTTR